MIAQGTEKAEKVNQPHEIKVGCNAIRDYLVDHLVCCDKKMVKQAHADFPTYLY